MQWLRFYTDMIQQAWWGIGVVLLFAVIIIGGAIMLLCSNGNGHGKDK